MAEAVSVLGHWSQCQLGAGGIAMPQKWSWCQWGSHLRDGGQRKMSLPGPAANSLESSEGKASQDCPSGHRLWGSWVEETAR